MEERTTVSKNHKLVVNNRKTSLVTGVLDVLSFDLNEVFLETEQGMLMVKGSDLHVNRLNLEKGEVDLSGTIDSIAYSDVQSAVSTRREYFCKIVPVTHATDSGRSRDFSCCTAYWDDRAVGLYRTECVPSNCQT